MWLVEESCHIYFCKQNSCLHNVIVIFNALYSMYWEISNQSSAVYINICMQQIPNGLFLHKLQYQPLLFLDNLELLHNFLCIMKISYTVILQKWENKSGSGSDPHPFWTWWYLIYTISSATFPLNVRIIWWNPFPDYFSSSVACVCNHCNQTNHNFCLTMGLMSHLFCVSNYFSS